MQEMELEEQERKARWVNLMERMETARIRRETKLDQRQRRIDLGLGYIIYCCRRFAYRSQSDLASLISSSQSTVSKWERNERLPSLSALGLSARAMGLELIIGLRDPGASTSEEEFVLLAAYQGEGRMAELDLFYDRYQNDYIPPRPWRAEIEARAALPNHLRSSKLRFRKRR